MTRVPPHCRQLLLHRCPTLVLTCVCLPSGRPIWLPGLPWLRASSSSGAWRMSLWATTTCCPASPSQSINLVTDFVGGNLPANPYTQLKVRLLTAHQLTDYQRVEQIFQLPPLGAPKPSELFAEMLRLCPRGQENSLFFTYLFLHCLPIELCVLLTDVDHADWRLLSERADQLRAHYAKHSNGTVACIDEISSDDEGEPIAAIRRQGHGSKHFVDKAHLKKGGSAPVGGRRSPSSHQQLDGWLCWYHHTFGDKANDCRQPCAWPSGN
jgi:hypothetical protein